MDLLTSGDLKGILDTLASMRDAEEAVAEFYHACGEAWTDAQNFWFAIEKQERKHMAHIERMMEIISRKPEHFEKGRPFNIMAVHTIIKGTQSYIERVRSGQMKMSNALFIARDTEQSVLESRYNEIVKTEDIEYKTLVNEVVADTVSHARAIVAAIATGKLTL